MRRDQILDGARKLLLSQGIENLSISKISKEAELGVGTIYFHYKNKEEIFIALQEEGLFLLFNRISDISEEKISPARKLYRIAEAYYDFSETQSEYYNIINYFLSSPKVFFEPDLKKQVHTSGEKILALIQHIVKTGNIQGHFFEKDPVKFSMMFWGTMHGLVHFKKLEQTALVGQNHKELYHYSVEKLIRTITREDR